MNSRKLIDLAILARACGNMLACRYLLILAMCLIAPVKAYGAVNTCEALGDLKLPNVERINVELVAAGPFTPRGASRPVAGGNLPSFCRVHIQVQPQINIEVWLPTNGWNERYHGRGVGGLGGVIWHDDLAQALRAGFATATTDTGHSASDKDWAIQPGGGTNMQALEDYGWRSLHQMAITAKAVITAYYGQAPRHSYFSGCSGGGRQGLMMAQRFPEDYDGILAGCAPAAFNRELANFLWPQVVMRERLRKPISEAKLQALSKAVADACDVQDGIADGLVNNPRECRFDMANLACSIDAPSATCLTSAEISTVRAIWDGPRSKDGKRLWFTIDKTIHSAMWEQAPYPTAIEHLRWVTGDPQADWRSITEATFEDHMSRAIQKLGQALDADNPDISRFVRRGGKLLLWHGDADRGDPASGIINYFYRVERGFSSDAEMARAVRLFLLPGVGHCNSDWIERKASIAPFPSRSAELGMPGVFPDRLFDALVAWVETGEAPDRVMAAQKLENGLLRTRPLCRFPKVAQWTGRGSSDDAANFRCVAQQPDPREFTTKYD